MRMNVIQQRIAAEFLEQINAANIDSGDLVVGTLAAIEQYLTDLIEDEPVDPSEGYTLQELEVIHLRVQGAAKRMRDMVARVAQQSGR